MYSQNNEEIVILNYFKDKKGKLLSIGENDGITLSNSRELIMRGWDAHLVEPAPTPFKSLEGLYKDASGVSCHEVAICDYTGLMSFWVSGEHLGSGDSGLLSTLSLVDKEKWEKSTEFNNVNVQCFTWLDFYELINKPIFEFITIDAEGYDLKILKQMDLIEMGTQMVCVEWNGKDFEEFDKYFKKYNMRLIHQNNENLIYAV